jgi:hypothetical protein
MQAARQAGQHAQRKIGVELDLAQHHGLVDREQQRVAQRLRRHHVGHAKKHHRLGKGVAGAAQLDHLLGAGGRDGEQLDLTEHRHVKLVARIAGAKDQLAALHAAQFTAGGQARELVLAHAGEQRQRGQITGEIELFEIHGWRWWVRARRAHRNRATPESI